MCVNKMLVLAAVPVHEGGARAGINVRTVGLFVAESAPDFAQFLRAMSPVPAHLVQVAPLPVFLLLHQKLFRVALPLDGVVLRISWVALLKQFSRPFDDAFASYSCSKEGSFLLEVLVDLAEVRQHGVEPETGTDYPFGSPIHSLQRHICGRAPCSFVPGPSVDGCHLAVKAVQFLHRRPDGQSLRRLPLGAQALQHGQECRPSGL